MTLPDLSTVTALQSVLEPTGITVESDPEPIGDKWGFASSRVTARVRLTDGRSVHAVVKVWDGERRGLGEILFYDTWAPRLPIRTPECSAHATDTYGLVVLEHLDALDHGDDERHASLEVAASLATILARVHRATVGNVEEPAVRGWNRPHPAEWHDTRRVDFIAWHGLPDSEPARAIIVQSEIADRLGVEMMSAAHPGLVHTDVHLDNVVFLDDGPVLLDWADPGWGPAAVDLAALLVSSVSPEDYDPVIEAYRSTTELTDTALHGAMLHRILIGTFGLVRWETGSERQARLKNASVAKALAAVAWLDRRWPEMAFHLTI